MPNWRDMAASALQSRHDDVIEAPDDWGLPPALAAAVRRLPGLPRPAVTQPAIWSDVTRDALRLASERWAGKALALGWSEHDLFGIGERGSSTFEGLAVWIAGRDIRAITDRSALTVCEGMYLREEVGRPNTPRSPAVFLWQFGRRVP